MTKVSRLDGTRRRIEVLIRKKRALYLVALCLLANIWLSSHISNGVWHSPEAPERVKYDAAVPNALASYLTKRGVRPAYTEIAVNQLGPSKNDQRGALWAALITAATGIGFALYLKEAGPIWRTILLLGPLVCLGVFCVLLLTPRMDPRLVGGDPNISVKYFTIPSGRLGQSNHPNLDVALAEAERERNLASQVAFVKAQFASNRAQDEAAYQELSKITQLWSDTRQYELFRIALMLEAVPRDKAKFGHLYEVTDKFRPGTWRRLPSLVLTYTMLSTLILIVFVSHRAKLLGGRIRGYTERLAAIDGS